MRLRHSPNGLRQRMNLAVQMGRLLNPFWIYPSGQEPAESICKRGLRGNLDGDWENLPSVTFKQSNRVFDVAWFGILIAGVAARWKLTASRRSKVLWHTRIPLTPLAVLLRSRPSRGQIWVSVERVCICQKESTRTRQRKESKLRLSPSPGEDENKTILTRVEKQLCAEAKEFEIAKVQNINSIDLSELIKKPTAQRIQCHLETLSL